MRIRLVVVLALLVWHSVAHATSFTVTNTIDDTNDPPAAGSLRSAIVSANAAQGSNTIKITATGTIALVAPLPTVSFTVTITGPGADKLTIQGSSATSPVLSIDGTVQLSGVTVTGGNNGGNNGGGISVMGGSLVLLDSTVTRSTAALGGGIYSSIGSLTILSSTISGNTGTGAVYGGGDTTVIDSTIADNAGTAIVFPTLGAMLSIDRTTISGNTDTAGVGGIQMQGGSAKIRNTTFSGNSGLQGGDFGTGAGVTLALLNVTATGGSAPALLFDPAATVTLRNTLFAGTGMRCSPGSLPTSQGHNLSSDMTCNLTSATDKPGVDAMLGPLAANGGPTMTHALLAGSPAVNAGDGASLEPMDQRGLPRVQFAAVDIGAVEVSEPIVSTQPAPQTVAEGDMLTLSVAAMNQNSTTALTYQWRKDGAAIAGAVSATFTKAAAAVEDSGMYDVLVINDGGGLASMAVAVTVTPAIKGDGGGGGCCSASGGGAGSSAAFAVIVAVVLGAPRRRRATSQRR